MISATGPAAWGTTAVPVWLELVPVRLELVLV